MSLDLWIVCLMVFCFVFGTPIKYLSYLIPRERKILKIYIL